MFSEDNLYIYIHIYFDKAYVHLINIPVGFRLTIT